VDIPDKTSEVIDVTCNANCEDCDITLNVEKDRPGPTFCRCAGNPRVVCDTINGPDSDCTTPGNNMCTCYFSAPLAISSGGTPVCVLNTIANDYGGTMNLRTGETESTVDLVSLVYLGIDQFAPCPTCDGDATANDGVRAGLCSGGLQSGTTCDENGEHPTFGPTSYDCPPTPGSNISGNGLQLDLRFTHGTSTLDYDVPCDPPFGNCACAVCSGNTAIACSSDQECIDQSAGTCTGTSGAGVQPNECDDGVCDNQTAECNAGPEDRFCDGQTHDNGRGYITCVTNVDCQLLGAGSCTLQQRRRCFPNPIEASGDPDAIHPILGTTFCIPATSSVAVNASGGLPGPGSFEVDFVNDIRCQNDPDRPYLLPDGVNCTVTTTTTTSTLSTCATTTPPLCVGLCPSGEGCMDLGGACGCAPTTTTTLPSCGSGAFPVCLGSCPAGFVCLPGPGFCQCLGLGL
jgi:hypothetical protein